MAEYLGIDTSNYTTSVALFNSNDNSVTQYKKLLPVKNGNLGLRQSDALFHHVTQLPEITSNFKGKLDCLKAVGVSVKPRNKTDSYMPCFLAGKMLAESFSALNNINCYKTSHQVGHILAAIYSCNRLDLINKEFIAFHISGGTTDCLLVKPDIQNIIDIDTIGTSLDLKAGQAIDRVGVMLGLKFPCGKELDILSQKSKNNYKIKPCIKDTNCCLSGLENKCKNMLSDKQLPQDIAKYCFQFIEATIDKMIEKAISVYGDKPLVMAGGVMSNSYIRKQLEQKYNVLFAEPEYSCDNATGTALYAYLKENL